MCSGGDPRIQEQSSDDGAHTGVLSSPLALRASGAPSHEAVLGAR